VDNLIDRFPFRLPMTSFGRFASAPALDMTETEGGYKITAELPGIEPENVEVTFEEGMLRIAGEKKEEREEKERGYRLSERSYGAFERMIQLPSSAEPDKIDASFKNGVLTILIPKSAEAKRNIRKISISRAS
jgi:HSP20 family protein